MLDDKYNDYSDTDFEYSYLNSWLSRNKQYLQLRDDNDNDIILYNTTAYWNNQTDRLSEKGVVYVYSDYTQDEDGKNIAGIKIGDGTSYLIDMPFVTSMIRVTQEEKDFWNHKVDVYPIVNDEQIVFTRGYIPDEYSED